MQQKTKIIYGFILVVLTLVTLFILWLSRSEFFKEETPVAKENDQVEMAQNPIERIESAQEKVYSTSMVNGEIVSVLDDRIELSEGGTKSEFTLNKNVTVVEINGAEVEKKDQDYLKKGQKVSLVINQADSEIILLKVVIGNSDPATVF